MSQRRRAYRRVLVPLVLSLILAAETIAVVTAGSGPVPGRDGGAVASVVQPAPKADQPVAIRRSAHPAGHVGNPNVPAAEFAPVTPERVEPAAREVLRPQPVQALAQPKSVAKSTGSTASSGGMKSGGTSFKGRNRMWMPSLGINRSVSFFRCGNPAYPGDRVYRWGCAGENNVYLFGHAHSVFKPLHDAYVRGRLRKGQKVVYADGNGKIRTYKIAWWKVTTPEKGEFAYAAQSRPSMTLQTCVGSKSLYRLIVRLVLAG